jgi:hypothetical protein
MNKGCFLLICFLLSLTATAQRECDCEANLKFLIEHTKTNYIGFDYKINAKNRKRLETLQDSVVKASHTAKDAFQCFTILDKWVTFFKDGHFQITFNRNQVALSPDIFGKEIPSTIPADEFDSFFSNPQREPIEGRWMNLAGSYQIAIVKDKTAESYTGYILAADSVYWKRGQVKLKLTKKLPSVYQGILYSRDHLPRNVTYFLNQDCLESLQESEVSFNWCKGSEKSLTAQPIASFAAISSDWNVLRIRSFGLVAPIDSVLDRYETQLRSVKNLIIDLRQNSGGGVATFPRLLSLVSDGKVKQISYGYLSTETNRKAYEKTIERLKQYPDVTDYELRLVAATLAGMKSQPNQLYWEPDSTAFIPPVKFPQRVYILFDRGTASAAEMFITLARQSSKTVTYGQPSAGAIDNLDAVTIDLPCPIYQVMYPISRNSDYRYTRPGIKPIQIYPQQRIPELTPDWVEYVIKQAGSAKH